MVHAESRTWKWTRRALTAAACAASAIDAYQSNKYLDGHHGLHEANGFLANPDGTVNMGRLIVLKAPFCAVPLIMGEIRWHHEDLWPAATIIAGAGAGVFTFVDVHNQKLIDKVAKQYGR